MYLIKIYIKYKNINDRIRRFARVRHRKGVGMGMGLTRKQTAMIALLIFGTFVAVLNQTVITPALPKIMAEMSVDASTAQWLTTGFTLVNAIMIPVTAFLIDRFPTRRLFMTAMAVFASGSVIAGAGASFPVLLAGRLVQAAGAGILQPLVMTVLLRTFPVERRGTAMGIFGIVIAFAPAIGPTAAGFVIDHAGWRILFYAIAALALAVVALAFFVLGKEGASDSQAELDVASVVLSTLGFGSLLYGLSSIGSYGVSALSAAGVAAGLLILVLFFRRQLKMERPMLQVRVLANPRFLVSTVIVMLVQGSLMAGSILMPIYMQNDLGFSATESGLVMLPAAILMGVMSPVSGRLFDKHGPRVLGILGMAILTATTFAFMLLGEATGLLVLVALYTLRMFGLSLANMPINTWGMNALPDELINHGTSVNNTFRQVAGSLGTAVIVSVSTIAESNAPASMSAVQASIHGIDAAFGVAGVLCLAGLVLAVAAVGDKPDKATETGGRDRRDLSSSKA